MFIKFGIYNFRNQWQIFVVVYFCLIIVFSSSAFAQIKVSNFDNQTHYTKKNGLLSSNVGDVVEDKNGFLWIASGNGITRFDGSNFTNYEHYNENETDYKIGFVNSVVIDESGEKLIIASEKGIFYSSINTINFKKINAFSSSINSPIKRTTQILLENQNTIWATSYGDGLLKINIVSDKYDSFKFIGASQHNNNQLNTIICITKDPINSDVLWLGTLAGFVRFNSVSKEYKVFVYNNNSDLYHNRIRKIYVSNTDVYLGTWNKGLVVFNKHNKQFKLPLKSSHPRHNLMLEFYNEKDQYLWMTTNIGLLQYDIATNTIKNSLEHSPSKGKMKGISFVDSEGIIWFGYKKGMFKYNPSQSQYKFIPLEERSNLQNALLVKRIIPFNDFIYVLGHDGTGLYKINATNYSFETIKITPSNNPEQTNRYLRDMVKIDDENLLILSYNKLYFFNTKTQKSHLSQLQINHPSPSLQSIVRDKNNRYWVGGRSSGLTSLDFVNNTITNYKDEFNVYSEGNHIWINKLYIDNSNKLWIAKGSSTVMDLDNLKLSLLNPKDSIPFYQDIYEFLEDSKGRVWAIDHYGGLGYINFKDFKKGIVHHIDGGFKGIYKHNDSLIWTTGNGLLGEFNINTNAHKIIRLNNNNEYVRGPIISDNNNKYIIGCLNGILIYNPESQVINYEIPKPYIRNVTGNGNIYYEESSLINKNLSFKGGTTNLVIEVSALGFQQPEQITYSYKIQQDWVSLNASQEINITNLTQGKYNFKIKACNEIGGCNEATYNFTILTPWYKSWIAYTIYGILILAIVWLLYRFNIDKQLAEVEKQQAVEIEGLKSKMYADISHEFRTPLTVILGMADTLKNTIKNKKFEGAQKSLEMIKRNGNNLLRLVNEMLDLEKSESGNLALQSVRTDIVPLVKYICESFNSLAEENQINLTVYSEIDALEMDIDPDKLTSVISNLLFNAIKFTPEFGKIIIHINQTTQNQKPYLFIKVKDNGIGISEEEIPHIFNRFYQSDATTSQKNKGTGIGLALTKELVELMEGTIEVKSTIDKGSEFNIVIPVSKIAPLSKNTQITNVPQEFVSDALYILNKQNSETNAELPLVLIIEDNMDVAYYLKACLENKYETLHAINGNVGIEMAFEKIPDIIICDVMMPEKDGFEVCTTLKSDERTDHIPIIILTAKVTIKDRLTGLKRGADAYLAKPFNKEELFTRLDQLVQLRKKLIGKIQKTGFKFILKKGTKNPKIQFLQKIVKLIHEDIGNSTFGSKDLAKKLLISDSQIYRKIKAITGKSTAVFIRSIRLQYAKELLKNTDKTVSEVAYVVGFSDPSWFSRAFKEEFGYAPSSLSK